MLHADSKKDANLRSGIALSAIRTLTPKAFASSSPLRDHALNFFDWPHTTFFDIGQPAGQRFVQFLCVWFGLEREQLRRQKRPFLRAQATNG